MGSRAMLTPSKRVSLSPRRGSRISPFAAEEGAGPEIWTPAELPGHRDYIPVLIMISGWRGIGKTLTMTMLGLLQRERYRMSNMHGWKLMANYPIVGADVVDPKIVDQLATFDPRMSKSIVCIDELPSYFPNRKSLRGINVDFSTFIQQVRKRDIEIIFTAQVPLRVDVQITEQVDWYIIPEVFGPGRRWLRLYFFDFKGQFIGDGHKYWPPKKEEADKVKIFGPLDSVYGKYPTGQVIAPQWSGYRDDIIAQDDWDESLYLDPADPSAVDAELAAMAAGSHRLEIDAIAPAKPKVTTLAAFIDQQETSVNMKDIWGSVQPFLPKGGTYRILREAMRERGYIIADGGYDAQKLE